MPEEFCRIFVARKRDRQFLHINALCCLYIRFIKTGITVYLVKIVHVQGILRTLVLYDIVSAKYPSDIFSYPLRPFFFDDQKIDLFWFPPQLVLPDKCQVRSRFCQFDLDSRAECRMPLEQLSRHTQNLLMNLSQEVRLSGISCSK